MTLSSECFVAVVVAAREGFVLTMSKKMDISIAARDETLPTYIAGVRLVSLMSPHVYLQTTPMLSLERTLVAGK